MSHFRVMTHLNRVESWLQSSNLMTPPFTITRNCSSIWEWMWRQWGQPVWMQLPRRWCQFLLWRWWQGIWFMLWKGRMAMGKIYVSKLNFFNVNVNINTLNRDQLKQNWNSRIKESVEDSSRETMPPSTLKMGNLIMQPSLCGIGAAMQKLSGRPKPSTEVKD